MPSQKEIIRKLLKKKKEIIEVARERQAILREKRQNDAEIAKLKRDIKIIKNVASKSIFRRLRRGLKSAKTTEAKEKVKSAGRKAKKFLKFIEKVAEKLPG